VVSGVVDAAPLLVAVETDASPIGFAGFTSSSGAFLLTLGGDFGAGPSNDVSGVGVGVGATRRGRDDCARAEVMLTNTRPTTKRANADIPSLGIRFFIGRILSDFQQNLQTI
jgi:hypothetical protein